MDDKETLEDNDVGRKILKESIWSQIISMEFAIRMATNMGTIQSVQYKRELIGALTDLLSLYSLFQNEPTSDQEVIDLIKTMNANYTMKYAVQKDAGNKEEAQYYKGRCDAYEHVLYMLTEEEI